MEVYVGPRSSGKTYSLMEILDQDPAAVMVVASVMQKETILRHGIGRERVWLWRDVIEGRHLGVGFVPRLLIDNADLILHSYLNAPIAAMSVTGVAIDLTGGRPLGLWGRFLRWMGR